MNELTDILTASSPLLIAIAMTSLGRVLKECVWYPDKLIPLTLSAYGAVGYMGLEGFTYRNGILGFVIGGMAAVGANQIWRQFFFPKEEVSAPIPPRITADFTGAGLNDFVVVSTFTGADKTDAVYTITITAAGTPDTYTIRKTGAPYSITDVIRAGPLLGPDGLTFTFKALTGHTLGDKWVVTVKNQ